MSTDTAPTEVVSLQHLKTSTTPLLDQLNEKQQVFVLTLYLTGNIQHSARKAGFHQESGRELARRPNIAAALREQQAAAEVQVAPTPLQIVLRLWNEAQNLTSNATARISALKTLADIKGMTGGGGNEGDSALDEFFRRAGRAVTSGVFDGLKQAGRKAVEGADAGAHEGEVVEAGVIEVDAKTVGPGDVNLGLALPEQVKEVE